MPISRTMKIAAFAATTTLAVLLVGCGGESTEAETSKSSPSSASPAAVSPTDRTDVTGGEQEALAVIHAMVRTYRETPSLRVDVEMIQRVLNDRTSQELTEKNEILYEAPNVYLRRDVGDGGSGSIYSNGAVTFLHRADRRATIRIETDMIQDILMSDPLSAALVIPVALLSTDGASFINRARPEDLRLIGETTIDGRTAQTVAFENGNGNNVQLDIAAEEPHLLLRQVETDMQSGVEIETLFTNQTVGMDFEPGAFDWQLPEDATLYMNTEQFVLEMRRGEPRGYALNGRPAPTGVLMNLDGGNVNLADHIGRGDVVLIDFWGTWCAPCRRTLPVLNRIARRFEGEGFLFAPIAVTDDPEDIRLFLSEQALDAVTPLQATGSEIFAKYNIGPLPHTVLIGPDGIVRGVKIGAPEDIDAWEAELTAQIEELMRR